MDRRKFLTMSALAIPTLTMGLSLKPNIPEIIDANYIWDVIIPKLPNPKLCRLVAYEGNGVYFDSNFNEKYGIHSYLIPVYNKNDLIHVETCYEKFLYWKRIIFISENGNTLYLIHFDKKYMDEYINGNFLHPDNLVRKNSLLEDWV